MSNSGPLGFLSKLFSPGPSVPVTPISVKEAFDIQKSQRALIIDVRTPAECGQTGIPKGGKMLPLQDANFEDRLLGFVKQKTDKPVIFICRSGARAKTAAGKAARAGLENIYVVRGGVPGPGGWVSSGLPTEEA